MLFRYASEGFVVEILRHKELGPVFPENGHKPGLGQMIEVDCFFLGLGKKTFNID